MQRDRRPERRGDPDGLAAGSIQTQRQRRSRAQAPTGLVGGSIGKLPAGMQGSEQPVASPTLRGAPKRLRSWRRYLARSSQNATALAAATLRLSTPWAMGIFTV